MKRLLSPVEQIQSLVMRRRKDSARKARRRAKAMGCARAKFVYLDNIRERDNQMCHLCNKWVSIHEASLDHVIPLSRGGEHTAENILLAHKVCNSKKGDRLMGEIDWATF